MGWLGLASGKYLTSQCCKALRNDAEQASIYIMWALLCWNTYILIACSLGSVDTTGELSNTIISTQYFDAAMLPTKVILRWG